MYATCRTLVQGSLDDSKSFGKITDLTFPRGFDKVYRPVHHLNVMEPPCSSTYHIPDKVVSDVYLLEQSSNTGFLNNRIPPLVVTENHSGIQCESNNSLKSFRNQTASHEVILAAMYSASAVLKATDFCFLLIQDIEADSKEKQHSRSALSDPPHCLPNQHSNISCSFTFPAVYLNP